MNVDTQLNKSKILREILNYNNKQRRFINENKFESKTIINVDIQPEYKNYISFNLNEWINFIN